MQEKNSPKFFINFSLSYFWHGSCYNIATPIVQEVFYSPQQAPFGFGGGESAFGLPSYKTIREGKGTKEG